MKQTLLIVAVFGCAVFIATAPSVAAATPDIQFFYSTTCPHCRAEQQFLDTLQERFPDLVIERLEASDRDARTLLKQRLADVGAERYLGVVPITFVGDEYFVGFGTPETTGADIIEAVGRLNGEQAALPPPTNAHSFSLPLIGEVDTNRYSLPALAVLLGLLDGFNVCSLGALVLILGMVLALQDRRRILLFGGIFLLTTAVVYGLLIALWFRAFSFLAPLTGVMDVLVALLASGGAAFFFREWWKMRRFGPTCGFTDNRFITWVTEHVQSRLSGVVRLAPAIAAILLFAGVITIVEFPCSAAVPVVFAGLLADAGYGPLAQLATIALFLVFYLLDELIVFGIAVSKMRLWLTSPTHVVWATFAKALVLLFIAFWYLRGVLFG